MQHPLIAVLVFYRLGSLLPITPPGQLPLQSPRASLLVGGSGRESAFAPRRRPRPPAIPSSPSRKRRPATRRAAPDTAQPSPWQRAGRDHPIRKKRSSRRTLVRLWRRENEE